MTRFNNALAIACAVAIMAVASNCNAQEFGGSDTSASDKPLSLTVSESVAATPKPLTYAQQRARFAEQQRLYRIEMRRMVGYSPLRPTVNASFQAYAPDRFYMPRRDVITMPGVSMWYW